MSEPQTSSEQEKRHAVIAIGQALQELDENRCNAREYLYSAIEHIERSIDRETEEWMMDEVDRKAGLIDKDMS